MPIVVAAALAGCGQKGPLYLLEDESATDEMQAMPADGAPAMPAQGAGEAPAGESEAAPADAAATPSS
ncbi:MAG: lipoprotein [Gammaproteobacteria bacterium]|nr:lipoprotein [Gammaproteobacteria bacterium]